jgi:HlyD family secretion protein
MKKKIVFPVIAAAAVGFLIWKFAGGREFLYAGTVEATEVDVSARVGSTIAAYDAKEGDAVRADQTLVDLSCEDVKLEADIAERDFRRTGDLYKKGSASQETFDRDKNRRDTAVLRRDWCSVKSPLDGTVLDKYHEPGELASPGTKLLTVADLRTVWMYVYVPQNLLAKISVNREVDALLPEAHDRVFKGRITFIRDEAEFTPKNVQTREERTRLVYRVKIEFANADGTLKPGMTLEARLPH